MKTIKQIADELGISKQAVAKRMSKLPPNLVVTNSRGAKLVTPEGEAILLDMTTNRSQKAGGIRQPTNHLLEVLHLQHKIETLELEKELREKSFSEQLEILNRELERKNAIIDEQLVTLRDLTAAMSREQALHAGTMQQQLTDGSKKGIFSRIFGKKVEDPS